MRKVLHSGIQSHKKHAVYFIFGLTANSTDSLLYYEHSFSLVHRFEKKKLVELHFPSDGDDVLPAIR